MNKERLTHWLNRRILDDGFTHKLSLLRHVETQGLRLQASVYEGELRECAIWTAFSKHPSSTQA